MKRFGLALGILIVIGAVAGMIFSSKLILIRNSWQKKTSDAKANVIAQRKKLAESEKAVELAKAELQRAIHGWERYWRAVEVDGQQAGVLGLRIWTNQGLALNAPVYVFQPGENGNGVSYVGPFKVKDVNEAQAALTPLWRLRRGEEASWRHGPNWRIRTNIPQQYQNTLSELQEEMLLRKDEILIAQQKHLQIQQEAKKSAEEHLQLRLKELNGDPNLVPQEKSLNRFLVEGLQKAVADTETARNAVQADVDELRRLVKRTRDEIERLTADNERLAKRLSGPAQTASKVP